jgi:circadian clock protein KaiC
LAGEVAERSRAASPHPCSFDTFRFAVKPTSSAPLARVTTGVRGLDPLLEGGLLGGGVYIIQGPPGAGKTILGNQICFHHAATRGPAVYVTLLAEAHTRMLAHLRRMGFFDPRLIPDRMYFVSAFKVLDGEGLPGLLRLVRETIVARGASMLCLDGLVSAEEVARSDQEFKKFIHELQTVASMEDCTVLLLTNASRPRGNYPEHTMVDGVVELSDELHNLRSVRRLRVRKLRGSAPVLGQHSMAISDAGIEVLPRFETHLELNHLPRVTEPPASRRLAFGIPRFDRMLLGGVPARSMTMLLGSSGCGKTTLALQFLSEGARRGEAGLHFGFFESPEVLRARSDRLGLELHTARGRRKVALHWQPSVERSIDAMGNRLLDLVHQQRPRRLVIDGIQAFDSAAEYPERLREVFATLATELEAFGVTTLYTCETPDLFGPRIEVPVVGVSAVTHNMIVLRHVELRSQMFRLISILKMRDSGYDGTIREFLIDDRGIDVADTFASAEQILTGEAESRMVRMEAAARRGRGGNGSRGAGKGPRKRS